MRNAPAVIVTALGVLLIGVGLAVGAAGPAAAHDEFSYTVSPLLGEAAGPGRTTSEAAPEPSPSVTAPGVSGGHGQPSGGGAVFPTLAVVTAALVVGGAVIVVLMVGRERRRRDRAGDDTGGSDED